MHNPTLTIEQNRRNRLHRRRSAVRHQQKTPRLFIHSLGARHQQERDYQSRFPFGADREWRTRWFRVVEEGGCWCWYCHSYVPNPSSGYVRRAVLTVVSRHSRCIRPRRGRASNRRGPRRRPLTFQTRLLAAYRRNRYSDLPRLRPQSIRWIRRQDLRRLGRSGRIDASAWSCVPSKCGSDCVGGWD